MRTCPGWLAPARAAPAQRRRRLAPAQRAQQIVSAAAIFFADHGFSASTRELAKRIGITQALIYRYFPSKDALVRRLLDTSQSDRWIPIVTRAMADRDVPVAERLIDFYHAFVGDSDSVGLRLWMRAALDGAPYPKRYADPLTGRVLAPMIAELRATLGLPGLAARKLLREERALAMSLHGALIFLRIRQHVYRPPISEPLRPSIAAHVAAVLPGVLARIKRAYGGRGADKPAAAPALAAKLAASPAQIG